MLEETGRNDPFLVSILSETWKQTEEHDEKYYLSIVIKLARVRRKSLLTQDRLQEVK